MLIKIDVDTIQSYLEDASGLRGGHADRVVVPENEGEIVEYLRDASRRGMPVTISGGGTGVTGGRVPFGGEVLSLERFNAAPRVRTLSPGRALATVQAGVLVSDLKKAALEKGWMYAPDPTEQTSFIGGNVATNASGSRGFKYGSTRTYVRRVRVILSTGEVFDVERGKYRAQDDGTLVFPGGTRKLKAPAYRLPEIKNAAGYFSRPAMDLIDLFIGQEGTLCVVTELDVELLPMIHETLGGVAFFPKLELSWGFVREAKMISLRNRTTAGALEAMSLEYFDRFALELLRVDYPQVPPSAEAAIFFEQALDGRDVNAVMDEWAELLAKYQAPLESVWFSNSAREQKAFREFRHRLPEKVNEVVRRNGFP
ncbi:MAG: FAD-binding oxidoreductase, partial [Endomicrobiales bacterium]